MAATNRDLEADVAAGRFREDLLYRINVVEVMVPPLRARREDILRLASSFLTFFAAKMKRPALTLSPAAEETLVAYSWPGNIRELRNVIERIAILWPASLVEPPAFPERMRGPAQKRIIAIGDDVTVEQVEREHIESVVARTRTAEDAAKILGIDASTLWRKRRKFEQP